MGVIIKARLIKSIFYPLDVGRFIQWAADAYYVEAAGWPAITKMLLQKIIGGANQLSLFSLCHGFQRGAVGGVGSVSHFHKNQHVFLLHDQIDLAGFALKVSHTKAEAPG